jgi:hypothetical protein
MYSNLHLHIFHLIRRPEIHLYFGQCCDLFKKYILNYLKSYGTLMYYLLRLLSGIQLKELLLLDDEAVALAK